MDNKNISSSLEDYLETIAELSENDGHAHTKEIATKLKVKMPSVTNALYTLAEKDLVEYSPNTPVCLTSHGLRKAFQIRNRHNILQNFFHSILKLDNATSDNIACKFEHIIQSDVLTKFVVLNNMINEQEDCKIFKENLEIAMQNIDKNLKDDIYPISSLDMSQKAVIKSINPSLQDRDNLDEKGLIIGKEIEIAGFVLLGNLIKIKTAEKIISISANEATQIWVELVN